MTRVALAGGIGAGKTVVTERLTSLGYEVIDADVIARDVVDVGRPAHVAIVDGFGRAVLEPSGVLDRAFVADVVFHDESARRRLNAITHPYIGRAITERFAAANGPLVFVALPLFVPAHRDAFHLDQAWAVEADPEVAVRRLTRERAMSEADARARIAAQMTNEERRAIVDRVLENNGSLDSLYGELDGALAAVTP